MGIDFDELLKPYKKGGTKENPVERTINTMCSALIYKNRIPPNIVGAVLLEVFTEMADRGLEFKGDGSYGSAGRALFQEIRRRCVKMAESQGVQETVEGILSGSTCFRAYCSKRTRKMVKLGRWNRFVRFMLKPRVLWRI